MAISSKIEEPFNRRLHHRHSLRSHSPTGFAMTVEIGSLLRIRFIVRYRWCVGGFLPPPYGDIFDKSKFI